MRLEDTSSLSPDTFGGIKATPGILLAAGGSEEPPVSLQLCLNYALVKFPAVILFYQK